MQWGFLGKQEALMAGADDGLSVPEHEAEPEDEAEDGAEQEEPEAEPEEPEPEAPEHGAIYCELCEMWLNGQPQWEDNEIGNKHKKNSRKKQSADKTVPRPNCCSPPHHRRTCPIKSFRIG